MGLALLGGALQGLGDGMAMAGRLNAIQRFDEWKEQKRAEREAALEQKKAMQPETKVVNGQVVLVRKDGSDAEVLHQAPEDFEIYAEKLGVEPGTEEYNDTLKDFVLKGNGPSAFGYDRQLQGDRLSQSDTNNRRNSATSRANNIRTTSTSQVNTLETQAGQGRRDAAAIRAGRYDRSRRGRGSASGNAARAVNPQTGRAIILRGGQWVDEITGEPVS